MATLSDLTPQQLQALLDGPALPPPPGIIPQLDHPPNLRTTGNAVQIVCLVLATLALCMRLYTKAAIIRQIVLADYAIVLGWSVYIAYFVASWLVSDTAAGIHQWNVRLRHLSHFLYYIHVGSVMYGICIFFIKWSILLQYLQIFVPVKKTTVMYLVSHGLIWANFIFYFVSTFVEIFACSPIRKVWDPLIAKGHCIDVLALNVAASSINSASDFGILILPQISIWRLQMSLKRKIQISGIFLIGIFACVASVVRLAYTVKLYNSTDLTYYSWLAGLWTQPEMASGIIVACLPVSPKFFQMLQHTSFFSRIGSSIQSLLHSTRSYGSNGDSEASKHKPPQGLSVHSRKYPPKAYEKLTDGQRLKGGPTEDTSDGSLDEGLQQPSGYILRTVDVDATTGPTDDSHNASTHKHEGVWQGVSSYNVSVMV